MLFCVDEPEVGGETLFVSGYEALANLDEGMRAVAERMLVHYCLGGGVGCGMIATLFLIHMSYDPSQGKLGWITIFLLLVAVIGGLFTFPLFVYLYWRTKKAIAHDDVQKHVTRSNSVSSKGDAYEELDGGGGK